MHWRQVGSPENPLEDEEVSEVEQQQKPVHLLQGHRDSYLHFMRLGKKGAQMDTERCVGELCGVASACFLGGFCLPPIFNAGGICSAKNWRRCKSTFNSLATAWS